MVLLIARTKIPPLICLSKRTIKLRPWLHQEHAVGENNSDILNEYVDLSVCNAWETSDQDVKLIRNGLIKNMHVLPNFITEEEEQILISEVEPSLKRLRYEFDHWDDAIHGFKEMEQIHWKGTAAKIITKAKQTATPLPEVPLPHIHILDLAANGYIKPHVDAIRFCGDTVAGICLLSPAVMRLRNSNNPDLFADFLLTRRCLYMMKGVARYDFSHEVLKTDLSYFKGEKITRTRRISLITRSQPDPSKNV